MIPRFTFSRGLVVAAAVGAHDVALHSAACYWAVWRVPGCSAS